jgi:CRP-like cAMP-binding protein
MNSHAISLDIERAARVRDPQQNRLLAMLSVEDRVRLRSQLEPITLHAGETLCGQTTRYLYFPTAAVVSLLYVTQSGASSEIAVIGSDGVVGLSIGGDTQPLQSRVQADGHAYRLRAQDADASDRMRDLLGRYLRTVQAQIAQAAVCNRHHTIDQQLCRRLLIGAELLATDELEMSHQLLANLLGVRRESVTVAAQRLQMAGIIRYSRGRIEILDHDQLELRACECHAVLHTERQRLLPAPSRATSISRTGAVVTRRVVNTASYASSFCRI